MNAFDLRIAKVVVQSAVQQLMAHPVAGPRLQSLSVAYTHCQITADELDEEIDALILLYLD